MNENARARFDSVIMTDLTFHSAQRTNTTHTHTHTLTQTQHRLAESFYFRWDVHLMATDPMGPVCASVSGSLQCACVFEQVADPLPFDHRRNSLRVAHSFASRALLLLSSAAPLNDCTIPGPSIALPMDSSGQMIS